VGCYSSSPLPPSKGGVELGKQFLCFHFSLVSLIFTCKLFSGTIPPLEEDKRGGNHMSKAHAQQKDMQFIAIFNGYF